MIPDLPVKSILDTLINILSQQGSSLLEAPPGAGKSTLVPLSLLKADVTSGKKILLLEPRRLAARSLAFSISRFLGEKVGGICGYRVHRESKVSSATRIEVVTEGVLVRMLQSDPSLEEIGLVIFDEFHERNLLSDLGLSLVLEIREELREDLKLLFMSATPDCESLLTLLPDLAIVRSEGRMFPVQTLYRPYSSDKDSRSRLWACQRRVALDIVQEALDQTDGDVLVFLPGEREIRFWEGELNRTLDRSIQVMPLFGRLSLDKQNQVISPHDDGVRRVVLATSIAETSLTIPGVTAVIDSGLVRRPLYNRSSGITLLETREISLASAEQRRGRAGRVSDGICYRLWDPSFERSRDKQTEPEILQADLTPLVLELACWGDSDYCKRKWLTPPPEGALASAVELLQMLDFVDDQGKVTVRGRKASSLPLHPRLAAVLLAGEEQGVLYEASLLAAFLEQRDFLPSHRGSDLLLRLEYLCGSRDPGEFGKPVKSIREEASHLVTLSGADKKSGKTDFSRLVEWSGLLTARGYPDRIGLRMEQGVYQLSGGGRVVLDQSDPLAVYSMILAAHCGGSAERQRLFLGVGVERKEIENLFGKVLKQEIHGVWDSQKKRVFLKSRRRLGELTLSETPLKSSQPELLAGIMADALLKQGLECLPWDKESRRLFNRMVFISKQSLNLDRIWPDLSPEALAGNCGEWLVPFMQDGRLSSLCGALKSLLDWDQQQTLESIAPDFFTTALGNRRKIDYSGDAPFLPVPLQEMYGTESSPLLGREPLVLHLLNPAGRPVQITSDLKSFWSSGWSTVRGELKGRYPKHYWPEDPVHSKPSLKTGNRRPDK